LRLAFHELVEEVAAKKAAVAEDRFLATGALP